MEVTITRGEAEGTARLRIVESRPLELLDLLGVPLPGNGQGSFGRLMIAA